MSLREKYTYPPYKDKKTELAQVSRQGKDKAGYTFRNSRSWILSTSQQCLSVLRPPWLLPMNDNWPVHPLPSLSVWALLEVMAVSPVSVFPGPTYIVEFLAHSQSQLLTTGNANFLSTWVDKSSSTSSSFPGNWGTSDSRQKGEEQPAVFILMKEENHKWVKCNPAPAWQPQPISLGRDLCWHLWERW